MDIKGNMIMFSDVPPGMPYIKGNNITLIVTLDDVEEIKRLFGLLQGWHGWDVASGNILEQGLWLVNG